jgi:Fe-S-cluster containining protein
MGYYSEVDFIKKETIISSWAQKESSGRLENMHTHISLKRKRNEKEKDERQVIRCRFMNSGGCGIYASKPGVCSMYPFISYLEINKTSRDLLYMRTSNLLEIVLAFT